MYIIIVQSGNCKEANISDFQNIAGYEVTSGHLSQKSSAAVGI